MIDRYHSKFLIGAFCSMALMTGCSKDEPDNNSDPEAIKKKTVLLYAVASNNLYPNLINDKHEILLGAEKVDLNHNSFIIYEVVPNNREHGDTPRLLELVKTSDGTYDFKVLKTYDRSLYSTDPKRIGEVVEDMQELCEAESYGMIFWSHGMGWSPFFSDRDAHPAPTKSDSRITYGDNFTSTQMGKFPIQSSFGYDTNSEAKYTDKTDIDELAAALPDNLFEFIWFDACMMTGIETIYEFRDKCDYFGGYPTEVFSPGMPYDLTLPYLVKDKADLRGCGEQFFSFYANNPSPYLRIATVCVVDMKELENIADFCKTHYAGKESPSSSGLDYYSGVQNVAYRYYDFGQYTMAKIGKEDEALSAEFNRLMDKLVIYKAATESEFTGKKLKLDEYSGLSAHNYNESQSGAAADYYRTLDWFKRVY